jgi:hypothetical protein
VGSNRVTTLRARLERAQGVAFDALLVAVAALVSESLVQEWLLAHPLGLYYGLSALHLLTFPALLTAIIMGWGRAGRMEELQRQGSGLLGWSAALFFGGSFIIPGVLGLNLEIKLWVMLTTIFGPLLLLGLWLWGLVWAERRGIIRPRPVGQRPPWLGVQLLASLTWAYLLFTETMMLVAAGRGGTISGVGLPAGVLLGYLPVRVLLYYVRDSHRWERFTITGRVLHLLWRVLAATR